MKFLDHSNKPPLNSQKLNILGCEIDCLSMEETLGFVEKIIAEKLPKQHVVVNAMKIVMMRSDPELKRIVNSCDVVNADGMPVVWASRLLKRPLPGRVAGIDLFLRLIELSAQRGYRPFFLGAKDLVLKNAIDTIMRKYPRLDIAGFRHGYFCAEEERKVAEEIRNSEADILFVGISSPKKEIFLNRWMAIMQIPFCMGVGGSFDVVAGLTKRAPKWMQILGLEWLHRIIQEPERMWKRYLKTNPVFVWIVLQEFFQSRKSQK